MSTVVVQARVGFISAVARVAAIVRLHRLPKGSWSPGIRIPFFLRGRKPEFSTDSPMQPSRASAQILRQYVPRSGCFQLARSQRTACCECGGNGGANP